ncbi:DUF2029 domain-containing protein [Tatlockia micdadei]|uniref:glycosyltransferase family 87 protein n=1 Tax=Legionella micdadei TaxID=451 RepID=UPI00156FA52F|nr:glycosyltransferase family 87 protein [Legionella micdadei]NSL18372.1 DUF2029 domain-containing protein [Legionella micdadei]
MKKHSSYAIFPCFFLIFLYVLLFYLIFSYQRLVDFTPFYTSAKLLLAGKNPYPIQLVMSVNLNPPFFIWLFSPLAHTSYRAALIIWSMLSFGLGLIAARIVFYYAFSTEMWKKYWLYFYLLYFSFFPILMDTSIAQVGAILIFLIMLGYHFYLTNRCYQAGIAWGIIIALKLFPALLFFYVLKQGRRRVFITMLATFLIACLIPVLFYGPTIYVQYHSMLTRVLWFGDSWNASLYGFLFRLLIDTHSNSHNLIPIELLHLALSSILLIIYLKVLGPSTEDGAHRVNHQPFCLTLVMMLLLSPFGWLYYFSILIFPLSVTFATVFNKKKSSPLPFILWTACFFLINFPQAYVLNKEMHHFAERISLYSFCFYGLTILLYFLISNRQIQGNHELNIKTLWEDEQKRRSFIAILIFYLFGLIVPLNSLLLNLSLPAQKETTLLKQVEKQTSLIK